MPWKDPQSPGRSSGSPILGGHASLTGALKLLCKFKETSISYILMVYNLFQYNVEK